MKNLIIEGPRGVGKSTITRYLREKTTNSTLINFTGFNEKGQAGLEKVDQYYTKWTEFFNSARNSDFFFIHDRYFFSEMVYSSLYKDYDFTSEYNNLVRWIPHTFDELTVVLLWNSSADELQRNLNRDKVELFGHVDESVIETLAQQLKYLQVIKEFQRKVAESKGYEKVKVIVMDVAGKSIRDVGEEILSIIE